MSITNADFGGRQLRRRIKRWVLVIAALLLIFWALPRLLSLYSEWLWFQEDVSYPGVFTTILSTKIGLGLVFGLLFVVLLLINVEIARRLARRTDWYSEETALRRQIAEVMEYFASRYLYVVLVIFALVIGYGVAVGASLQWDTYLQFRRALPFNIKDPVFQQDVGFYVFRLPFWRYLWQWSYIALIAVFVITALVHYLDKAIRMLRGVPSLANHVKIHLSILLALILGVKALGYRLEAYDLLFSSHRLMTGAGYTDVTARLLAFNVLFWMALAVALIVLVSAFRRGLWAPLAGLGFLLVVSFLLGTGYPAIVQRFQVAPAEYQKEAPYLKSAIDFTRRGYGLATDTRNVPLSSVSPLTVEELGRNVATLENVRLWDYRPLLTTYEKQQALQPYYRFGQVDVDRYTVNGRYRQVMLSARELVLPGTTTGWQNEHLVYTHGYGIVMSPVADTVATGLPDYWVLDIPCRSPVGLKVTRAGIYYGEMTKDYAVVKTTQPDLEIDYGTQEQTVKTTYRGKGGVRISSLLVRVAAALRFGDTDLLISPLITKDSRILWEREVDERVRHIAPFLSYDKDPYIVLGDDGRLYWIIDAYTTSSDYPYSDYRRNTEEWQINYVRNSVKAVVDAYDGTVDFYVADPDDPIIRVYQRIFPKLFKPKAQMPAGLQAHLRYPEGLFEAQSSILTTYHVTSPQVFYNNGEAWQIAREARKTVGPIQPLGEEESPEGEGERMQAYYAILSQPGKETPEFLLMLPFTPQKKTNMAAWFAGQCDGLDYGKKLLYEFPRSEQIWGPIQIEGIINQNTEFSQIKTLLNQEGSTFTPGNLLVLPMDTSILYVEPYYLSSTTGGIPELKYVVVARGDGHVAFGTTLSEALTNLVGQAPPQTAVREATGGAPVPPPTAGQPAAAPGAAPQPLPADVKGLAQQANREYKEALDKQKQGDWAGYGDALKRLQRTLKELEKKTE